MFTFILRTNMLRRAVFLIIPILFVLYSTPVFSEDDLSAPPEAEKALEEELRYMKAETYVITASRVMEDIKKSAASITVITDRQIRQMGARHLSDAAAQSTVNGKQKMTPFQKKRQERMKRREQVQENRSERRKSFQDALKDIVVASKEEIEKRKQIKEELTQGKGIKTSKKVVRLKLPLVSKQHDGWSCGLNTATRLLKYNNYDASYEGLIKQRKLVSLQLDSDKGPYTLPPALQRIMRRWHPESWWMTDVEFDVIKNLLRQNKPVAALIAIPGSYFKIKLGQQTIKAPASHWVVVSGFNDIKKTIYYYDPLKEGEQQKRYDDFLKVWATKPEDYMEEKFDPLLLTYGFIATRTIAFCN